MRNSRKHSFVLGAMLSISLILFSLSGVLSSQMIQTTTTDSKRVNESLRSTKNTIERRSSTSSQAIALHPRVQNPQDHVKKSVSVEEASSVKRTRPAFEKLLIGPLMVFGEKVTGGHYLEVLRLGKQMATGKGNPSYFELHRSFVTETGFLGAFYLGFLPWGLIECLKGLPVLFVQNECMYQMQHKLGWKEKRAEKFSGFLGGAVQAIFVCPIQKIKVAVVASPILNKLSPLEATQYIIKTNGVLALYDGIFPTMLRRSLDWGIRFGVSAQMKRYLTERKEKKNMNDQNNNQLDIFELILCGLIGGAVSALTHPIDNIITNSQKPMPRGTPTDLLSVIIRMYNESGGTAFTRGFAVKVFDNAYHTAWMYGVGAVIYDRISR